MPKTVKVVDETGKEYEATYFKRAQGLVKKGRARFIDENTICLVCPPNQNDLISEDKTMENTMKHTDTIETNAPTTEETAFLLPETDDPECITLTNQHHINYCLKKIDEIGKETESLVTAIKSIASLDVVVTPNGNNAEAQTDAIAQIFGSREITNQKKIDFYRDMIDRFLPPKKDADQESARRKEYLDWIRGMIDDNAWVLTIEELVKLYREFQ